MSVRHVRVILAFLIMMTASTAWAQTVTWSDSFEQGKTPSSEQCLKWSQFLGDLKDKRFASVHLSGEFDAEGKWINDPEAATALAELLSSKTPGTVNSGGNTWTVTHCDISNCLDGMSIALSVNGDTETCECSDLYAIRPQARNANWGGINTGTSCSAKSQFMNLKFHSGVSIVADGSSSLCGDGKVVLTAQSTVCSPQSFLWSTKETTPTITVTQPGNYTVEVSDGNGCWAISESFTVTGTDISVNAGADVTICEDPVQLNAVGVSSSAGGAQMVNEVCLFDSPGGIGSGQCNFVTRDVCLEGQTPYGNGSFSKEVSIDNPVEINFKLYYSADYYATFKFMVNDQEIGLYYEGDPRSTCEPMGGITAPRTVTFDANKFKHLWKDGAYNKLTVSVEALDQAIKLTGLVAEVVTSDEFYTWSPATGLSVASIANPIASPENTTTYTVTYRDASGCEATDQVEVKVQCSTPPVAACKPVSVSLSEGCAAVVDAKTFYDETAGAPADDLQFAVSPSGPYPVGITEVMLTVTNARNESSSCKTTVTVVDEILPTFPELTDVLLENEAGKCSATHELVAPEVLDNCGLKSVVPDFEGTEFPDGETLVTWTATDVNDNIAVAVQKVIVSNAAPQIISVESSPSEVFANSEVTLTISHGDDNLSHATIAWGDGSEPEVISETQSTFDVSHVYAKSGSYSATVTLTDFCGGSNFVYTNITVIDGRPGQVDGGGWFDSPRGAYLKNPRAHGKATFAFEASNTNRYNKPEGKINFNFKDGGIKFRSSEITWLDVFGASATLKGSGRLNGKSGYEIFISVLEDQKAANKDENDNDKRKGKGKGKGDDDKGKKDLDFIRVRISDASGKVVYDTQFGEPDGAAPTTPVKGGSIKIKPEEARFNEGYESPVASSFGEGSASAYPNPFEDQVDVEFSTASRENVVIVIMDLSGRVVYNQVFAPSEDGYYTLDVFEDGEGRPGIYIAVIKQGRRVEFLRLVHD